MDIPENVTIDYLVKIVLIGDTQVGKTQIINQWLHQRVVETSSNIGVEFASKHFNYLSKKIKAQIWDTAGQERFKSITPIFFQGAHVIFLVVAANDTFDKKIEQINNWQKLCPAGRPIIIIENKTDLTKEDALLTDAQLADKKIQYFAKVSVSALQGKTSATLNAAFERVLTEIFPVLKSVAAADPQLPINAAHNIIKNLRALNDTQVNMLCTSLRNLLIRGPINQPNKSYDMKFGGGKTYVDEKIPEHVHAWICSLDFPEVCSVEAKRSQLITVYEDIIKVSQHKPFFRSSSTHDFYKEQLTGLIESWVIKLADDSSPYFNIRENIKKLATFPEINGINVVRDNIIYHLKQGPLTSQINPYNVSFFGSKKYKLPNAEFSISVPAHVSAILNYLNNDQTDILSKLIFVLDYSIASKFSTCNSRDRTTQEFYNNLPDFIAAEIAGTLESLQGNHALHPPIL